MPKNIFDARNELLRLGRITYQIPAQEDTLASLVAAQGGLNTTGVIDVTNKSITGGETYQFISFEELGLIEECLILSPSTDFSVIVNVDGEEILDRTYTQYTSITQVLKDISAFEERDSDGNPLGKYTVHLININFKDSITIEIKNNSASPITFDNLFCKYKTV